MKQKTGKATGKEQHFPQYSRELKGGQYSSDAPIFLFLVRRRDEGADLGERGYRWVVQDV